MPRILLFAATTGYQTRSFAAACAKLGVDAILATDRCHIMEDPWGDAAVAIRFEAPQESAELISADIRRRGAKIDGVLAVADRPTQIAALVAERMGLPWHSQAAAAACRDKHRMRFLFEQAGLRVPGYHRVTTATDPHLFAATQPFPCVLKPLGLSGSRGVIRANDAAEFIGAFERIRHILARAELQKREAEGPQFIQVEQYIQGREFALEGVMSRGDLRTLAIFDKPDPLEGPFFEETIYVAPSRESASTQRAIVETTTKAARALGLWHGPIHAEMRVNDADVFMLEIAARPIGGLCARALRFQTPKRELPISLEELLVLHAIGEMPEEFSAAAASTGVMMIPVPRAGVFQAVHRVDEALAMPGVLDVVITAKPGETLIPLPEGASYTGFIFASGPDAKSTETSLRRAHGALRFVILSALDVLR